MPDLADLSHVHLLLIGAIAFLAIHQFSLWLSQRDPRILTAAAWCAIVLLFLWGRYLQHHASDNAEAIFASQVQYAASFPLLACTFAVAQAYVGRPLGRRAVTLLVLGTGLVMTANWWSGALVGDQAQVITDLLGHQYLAAAAGPLLTGYVLLMAVVQICLVRLLIRHRAAGDGAKLGRLLALSLLLPLLAINDMLMSRGILSSIQLFEFGLAALVFVINDLLVSQLHDAVAAARRSEAGFRALIEGSPDAITVSHEERIRFVNQAALACFGHASAADLLGRSALDLVHPDDRVVAQARRRRTAGGGGAAPLVEERYLRVDGGLLIGEVAHLEVSFEGVACRMDVVRDVTARKAMETQLDVATRVAALGTLAAGVGHEINNPLTAVVASLDLAGEALRRLPNSPDVAALRALLEDAGAGADRVKHIVRSLRTLSRPVDDAREPVDVREVLTACTIMTANQISQRARLILELGDVPPVLAERGRLGQVFVSLLTNAVHALPEGAADRHRIVVATAMDGAGRVVVEIRDSGCGMTSELLPRIFEPFFTTRPFAGGTGLGLSISLGLVRELGGDIQVTSALGQGSAFRVVLPAPTQLVVAPVVDAPAPPGAPTATARRILIVDDEPLVARSLQRALRGHSITVASSGAEALRLCRETDFAVIFCDVMMPDVSGMDVYRGVREARPGMEERIVFITGGAFTERARAFLDSVPNHVIEKPVAIDELRRLAQQLVGGAASEDLSEKAGQSGVN